MAGCPPDRRRGGRVPEDLVAEPPIKPGTPDPYEPPKPGELRPQTHLQIGPIMQYVTTLVRGPTTSRPTPTTGSNTRPDERKPGRRTGRGRGRRAPEPVSLLACFAEAKRAAKARRQLNERIEKGGDAILDQVVVAVGAKRKAKVHDPRRAMAGALTPVLTWGAFGLLAGGRKKQALWAIVGAICGGLYAYYSEHLLTKDELKRLGSRCPADSSAIVAWVRGAHPQRILSAAAASQPATASVAAVTADLSAQVTPMLDRGETHDAALNMLVVRFAGEHAADRPWPSPAPTTRKSHRSSSSSRRTSTAGAAS